MTLFELNPRSKPVPIPRRRRPDGSFAPPGATLKVLAVATAAAMMALPASGVAETIGELDVRSRLGERFFGAVPVQTNARILDPRCVQVLPNPNAPPGTQSLRGARVRIGSADSVIIETNAAVTSPVIGLRLALGCQNPVFRDFLVLGEGASIPGLTDLPAQPVAAQTPVAAPPPAAAPNATRSARRASAARTVPRPPTPAAAPAPDQATRPVAVPSTPPARSTATQAAVPSMSAAPFSEASDATHRLAELRARSDDQAAALLALNDRLELLQKQAELLRAQLGQVASAPPSAGAPDLATQQASTPSQAGTAAAASGDGKSTGLPGVQRTESRQSGGVLGLMTDWRVAGGLAALLLGAFVLVRRRRPTSLASDPLLSPMAPRAQWEKPSVVPVGRHAAPSAEKTQEMEAMAAAPRGEQVPAWQVAREPAAADQTVEWIAPPTTDTMPAMAAQSREFHITQQFQPDAERVVALASPEEIVQQARTHYMEDGDLFRAIDLLEMAVAARKDSTRPWQALFAIYHRENMADRFERLALEYQHAFGADESWPTIRALGRAIDADNPQYGDGPPEPIPGDLVERWLGAPLDFTSQLLANEMHDQLMSTYPGYKRRKRTAQE